MFQLLHFHNFRVELKVDRAIIDLCFQTLEIQVRLSKMLILYFSYTIQKNIMMLLKKMSLVQLN